MTKTTDRVAWAQGLTADGKMPDPTKQAVKKKRGFASMDPQRQREIASMGGKQAHRNGTAYEFTSEVARKAGKLSHKNRGIKRV